MSARELRGLLASGVGAEATGTRSGKRVSWRRSPRRDSEMADDEADTEERREAATMEATISALRDKVWDLETQLQEAQHAIQSADRELKRVSDECERVSAEARGVSDLATSLKDLTGSGPSSMASFFTAFMESQAKLLTAQTNALAIQSAPPLVCFSGEDVEDEEKSFVRWLERFEERAKLLSWSAEQKCYQLKVHLTGTAAQVFQLLTAEQRNSYTQAVGVLKARFKPVDIEELRGLEFHQLMQTEESVEKLGLRLMTLAGKAFPSVSSTELDRLLKGRFFQALLPKWKRKLGAPKVGETFNELYERARTSERHDKQYQSGSSPRTSKQTQDPVRRGTEGSGATGSSVKSAEKTVEKSTGSSSGSSAQAQNPSRTTTSGRGWWSSIKCFQCGGPHFKRNCPQLDRSEAPGSSKQLESSTATVGVTKTAHSTVAGAGDSVSQMTDEQLEEILVSRRCLKEQELLQGSEVHVSMVTGKGLPSTIGATLELDVRIEGVGVAAMIDTGSQSSIISRAVLHQIGGHLKEQGKPVPQLQPASVRLFGKDGKAGRHELRVTAQVTLQVEADGVSVPVLLFVQPDSSQPCLIGMNAAPALGLSFLNARGQPLRRATSGVAGCPSVSLIEAKAVPARAASFVEVQVEMEDADEGTHFVFEPDPTSLEKYGLGAPESLVQVTGEGKMLIPVVNYQQQVVHLEEGTELGKLERVCGDVVTGEQEVVGGSACGQARNVNNGSMEYAVGNRDCGDGAGVQKAGRVAAIHGDVGNRRMHLLESVKWPEELEQKQLDQLKELVVDFEQVFAVTEGELGCTELGKHNIDTGDHPPIKQYPRRTPFVRRAKIASMIADMEKRGVVKPSLSPWASPVVLVPKRDGTTRFCVDYRRLNAVTKKDVYPLPRIEDILDTVGRCRYFTTLDLSAGYWQIPLDAKDAEKTAFTTHCGLFEFTRMPFGLCNAPSTFQRLMQMVLAGLEWKCCFVYIDDILVCSRTFEEHIAHLRLVFERLLTAHLKLKLAKCYFLRKVVQYLGHLLSREGISPDPAKTSKVKNFPVPTDVTSLRQFLGLASYYRRFIPNFAKVSGPLHALTKKGVQFEWTVNCQEAFEQLKHLLCSSPVLAYPQFGPGHQFVLETDASLAGLGAVLSQRDEKGHLHPVAYASRTLHKHEHNYPITELETLGLVWAVKYFRAYILGHHCVVLTDHAACTSLLNAQHPSAKLARWAMIIQEMDLEIRHRSGKTNYGADALSRNPVPEEEADIVAEIAAVQAVASHYGDEQYGDSGLKLLIDYLRDGTLPDDDKAARSVVVTCKSCDILDGILHHENPAFPGRWCVAIPKARREELIREAHDGRFSGHFAEKNIFELLRRRYWWPGMRADVRRYCRSCLVCASRKGTGHAIKPALQPIPVGGPFHRMGVDVLQLPLTCDGNQYAVVFIDYLTKWVEAFAVPDQTAETIARLFVEGVVCRHGAPQELLSDRGANFLSELVSEVCKLFDVRKVNTSGYHPQTNGLCERFNSTLIQMLAKTGDRFAQDWDRHLPYVLYAYRVAVQESTRESPFFLVYGRDPTLPTLDVLSRERTPYMVDLDDYKTELMTGLTDAWKLAKENIEVAQCRQKVQYDRTTKEPKLVVGQRVMVHMPTELQGKTWKFARPFHGPFRIVSLTPTNAEVILIDEPKSDSMFVSLNRVRPCYPELADTSWRGTSNKKYTPRKETPDVAALDTPKKQTPYAGPMTRSRTQLCTGK